MSIKRITAIVPLELLDTLEQNLRRCGVPGVTVEHVRGYGEHPNFFRRDLMRHNVRVVLYASEARVDDIIGALADSAQGSGAAAGIVSVETVERLVGLPEGRDVDPAAL